MTANPEHEFTAYIDEAGDDGISRVKPIDENGSSEWFVMSAVIVRKSAEQPMIEMVRRMRQQFGDRQRADIDFRDLAEHQKEQYCGEIGRAKLRSIVVVSHKPNMRGYKNPRAAKMGNRNSFYCWIARLLLERITHLCHAETIQFGRPSAKVKLVFSKNGGVSYSQMRAYFDKLQDQSRAKLLVLPRGDLAWPVYDRRLLQVEEHHRLAGLQVADAVASAFYQALEPKNGLLRPLPATYLKPILARTKRGCWDFGLKMMPEPCKSAIDARRLTFLQNFG